MFVYGSSLHSDLVAVIVPNEKICLSFIENAENWTKNPNLKSILMNKIVEIGLREQLKAWEIPKDIVLDSVVWTSQNGLLTG
jgi:fatty acid CoA ligase FadD9